MSKGNVAVFGPVDERGAWGPREEEVEEDKEGMHRPPLTTLHDVAMTNSRVALLNRTHTLSCMNLPKSDCDTYLPFWQIFRSRVVTGSPEVCARRRLMRARSLPNSDAFAAPPNSDGGAVERASELAAARSSS